MHTPQLVLFNLIRGSVDDVEDEIEKKVDTVTEMDRIKEDLESAIGHIKKSSRMNAIQSVAGRFSKSPVASVMALVRQIDNTTTALDIVPKLEKLKDQIDIVIDSDIDIGIYQRTPDGYNAVWDLYVEAYGNLSGQDLTAVNKLVLFVTSDKHEVDLFNKMKKALPDPELLTVKECNGVCGGFFHDADTHLTTDPCKGCGESWYTCDKKAQDRHRVRYCGRGVFFLKWDPSTVSWTNLGGFTTIYLGKCGQSYRKCDDKKPEAVHWYGSIVAKNSYTGGKYLKGWRAGITAHHKSFCGSINSTTPPAVSIHGPNGVGVSDSAVGDASPGCTSCLDGSKHCPDAGTKHPKTVPDRPKSFSVSKGRHYGSIELTWTDSEFDGGLPIKDYQYAIKRWMPDKKRYSAWVWSSAGKDNYEYISTAYSKGKYCIKMRAENKEGYSKETGIKIVYSK